MEIEIFARYEKVRGYDFDEITAILRNNKVRYKVTQPPRIGKKYLLESEIKIPHRNSGKAHHVLPQEDGMSRGRWIGNGYHYFSYYRPLKEINPLLEFAKKIDEDYIGRITVRFERL